jgi:hypothetical protein
VQTSYCKFVKLVNGDEIIVTTDNNCNDYKNDRYLSVIDPVEVRSMQMVRGPHIVETHIMQPWIRMAKDDIVQIPTDNILVIVDVKDDIVDQYTKFLYQQQDSDEPARGDIGELIEDLIEDSESENLLDANDYQNEGPTFH